MQITHIIIKLRRKTFMGFFGFIGKLFKGFFDIGKAVLNAIKKVFTQRQNQPANVTYDPSNPIYTYGQPSAPQQYHRDELRWENDPTDPENPNNANAQEMRRMQQNAVYMNQYQNMYQSRVPYSYNGDMYSYGYMNQMNPVSNTAYVQTAYQTNPWSYPQTPYNVQVQNMNHQYSNQELRWKESPEAQIQMYGRVIHPYDTPASTYSTSDMMYGKSYTNPTSQYTSTTQSNRDDWATVKWASDDHTTDDIPKFTTMVSKPESVVPLKDTTPDGVVCAFGRRSENYVGNAV
jgi:hypothetical protein